MIQAAITDLRTTQIAPDTAQETQNIAAVAQSGTIAKVKKPRIDLFLEAYEGTEYYFDLKTAKPNMGDFIGFKRMLMEWTAMRAAQNPNTKIKMILAIPYEPEPYARWTILGLFDIGNEVLVADEFWNFLGGDNTYTDLLQVFEEVGIALRPEIDARFNKFK